MARTKKIYWYPARLVEDALTGEVYVLMYGGGGRARYVSTTEIQQPIWDERRFQEKSLERRTSANR